MPYKSILAAFRDTALDRPALDAAAALAGKWDAHLRVLCFGLDRTPMGFSYADASASVMTQGLAEAEAEARRAEEAVRAVLEPAGIRWDAGLLVAPAEALGGRVAREAQFTDLVVLPGPYGAGRRRDDVVVLESALFGGNAPVLVLPGGAAAPAAPARIALAWNDSPEAMAAVRRALPLLKAAGRVDVVIVDPPSQERDLAYPGDALSRMLSRHGVKVEVTLLPRTLPRVSEVILRHAVETGAELLVMGAYGHSRLREAILGGATRNVLEHATVPVLLAR